MKLTGRAKMLRIYIGEDDRWEGVPLYTALVERFRALDIAGATVYRGTMGYGSRRRLHREKRLALSSDRPVMITVVDTEEKIRALLPMLDLMIPDGLIVMSDVDVLKYARAPRTGAGEPPDAVRPDTTPEAARSGAPRSSAAEGADPAPREATAAGAGPRASRQGTVGAGRAPGAGEPHATAVQGEAGAVRADAGPAAAASVAGEAPPAPAAAPVAGAEAAPQPGAASCRGDRSGRA